MTQPTQRYTNGAVLLVVLTLFGVAVASAAAGAAGVTDKTVSSDDSSVVALNESVSSDTLLGDVNQDGTVRGNDALLIAQESAGIRGGGMFFGPAADMNRDGDIKGNDALLAAQKSAGILNEADVAVSNLSAPGTVTAGGTVTLSADLENLGNEGALQNITVRAAPEGSPLNGNATLAEQFVDIAVAGVDTPVSRPAQTNITFENVTVDLDPGNYTLGIFSENDNVTAPLTIEANSEVTGTVTASGNTTSTTGTPGTGEPVPNATVTLYEGDSTDPADAVDSAAVDQNGNYLFERVSPGSYTVEADAVNFSAGSALLSVGTNETVQQDFALDYSQGGSVSGQLSLGTADPGEDVAVTVTADDGTNTYTDTVSINGSNTTATYTLSGVDVNVDAGYTVTASSNSTNYDDPASVTVEVDVNETVTQDFEFTRQTGGANGTVVASGDTASTTQTPGAGEGVENAAIEVYAFQGDDSGTPTFTFENATDTSGAFDLPTDTFPVGEHFVVVSATNLSSAGLPVTIDEGSNDLGEITLDYSQGGSVSGQLSLGMVDPGEDVPVTVRIAETGDSTQVTLTGDNGTASYTIDGVDVNVDDGYTVTASEATGNYLAPANTTNVTVDVNATTTGVNFGFDRRTGAVNGTVTNANTGNGVANATIEVSAFGPGGPVVASDTTDVDGEYTISGLPVGSHQVTVLVDGFVAGNTSATVLDNQTVTQDFALNASSLQVSILDNTVAGVAGATQTLNASLTNTGDLPVNQTVTLDWGNGTYTSTTDAVVPGGSSVTETLSITTDATQPIGFYTAEVASEDDNDTVEATLAPERSINASEVPAGGTVEVTVSGQVGNLSTVDLADEWSPDADGAAQRVSSTFTTDQEILGSGAVAVVFQENSGNFEYVYQFDVSPDATAGSVYEWQPLQGGDGSALQVDGTPFPVLGDESFEIAETVDDVLLDSVSSLLNASGQPLVDDSITAIEAEPSATNEDTDGDGDAVSYPSDVDIPVMAVDGGVVGVTGPFVTGDTDFANFGNEEVMLNLYDELLGGSGTIVHDEGHGQFYTLAPNGGDDFQAFAGYAESNGYTYTNTTDIQNATGTADAFVITSPSDAFTQSELDALSTFVDNGGVLFLHDQSDFNNFDATDNHNAIASAVNASFRFNDDQVVDDQNNTGARFVPTTGNFDTDRFTSLFSDREGLGLELNVSESYEVDVVDVTDGDTADVEFNNSEGTVEPVRIVGIDTPETGNTDERLEEYEGIDNATALKIKGDEATTYAQSQLSGKTVTLSFDETEGLRGNFGRLLGFLELPDGSVYNEEVIRDGWARVYDSGFAGHDEYWDLEQQARANSSGIWEISDPANTSEIRDDPVTELFFPQPVEVSGPETPVSSENGEPLVALDRDANVAALGGPLVEERYETAEGGPGIDQYEVFPFVTNVMEAVGNATGPVVVDAGHDQFASDYAVSAEDTAYYLRYLEGQSPGNESFIGLDGTVDLASDPGPDLVENGSAVARAVIISTPNSELSPAERTAVADFADAGGAVILLGSSANTTALSNFDSLLSDLNTSVGFTTTAVTDATNNLAGDSTIPTTSNFSAGAPELFTAFTPPEAGASFNVSNLNPASATVLEGEAFDVSATVTNEGTESDNQTVELRLEPDTTAVATQQVELNASENTTVIFENVTVEQAGEYNHTVASLTDQTTGSLTVEPLFDDVFLDSVSSLLNASGQPLTDDSITAIEAEPTASNTDADGDGDAVSYPNDVDIPVAAVDGNVVGITGPFVASDTDFGTYGNEEFLLNVYDRLLGGSGTIVHDEGHGQFYTLAPNGGDDFQTFAGFAESEGYTYTNTTDIQNATSTADAFVITTPSDAFTQSELDALSTFVDNGGVVFLHDQSDFNNFDATDNHNEIASAVNASFRFNDDQVTDDTNNGGASFLPVTGNFNDAEFPGLFTEGSFNVSGLTPADATVSQGESFSVSATVTNEGDGTGELPVELRLEPDGSAVRTQTVRLAAGESTTVTFSNLTVEQVGEYNHTVASPGDSATGSLTVQLADVFLDSVSSLLNASGQPLTDDSITAIEAESTASNTDSDGDGDAVSYPSDVDIPVAAVDGNVVGITGPFVTDDTDFGAYSNEEFLLNVYDELLGGSGTIVHDNGHGQFYSSDNYQSFAGYAESNGYTYTNTTDIQNATSTADAFVITTPSDAFTQSELDALSTFVDNGGVLFLHDQSDFSNFDATDNHNAIASAVNASFRFNDDQVVDNTNNGGASFLPVTGNFNEADFPGLFEERNDTGLSSAIVTELGAYDPVVATSG